MLIPTCLIKLLELSLVIACLTLHIYSFDLTDVVTLMLCSGTFVGFLIVLTGEIVGEMVFAPLDLIQDVFFALLGVAMFSASGGKVLSARLNWSPFPRSGDQTIALLAGSLSLVTALVMLLDLIIAFMDSEEYVDEKSEAVSALPDAYVDAWWSASGALLFGACGFLTFHSWRDVPPSLRRSHAQAAAGCALATAAVLVLDALLALCSTRKDDAHSNKEKQKDKPHKCNCNQ